VGLGVLDDCVFMGADARRSQCPSRKAGGWLTWVEHVPGALPHSGHLQSQPQQRRPLAASPPAFGMPKCQARARLSCTMSWHC
jgi:hypothetical protein